jgi:hypothetical protein
MTTKLDFFLLQNRNTVWQGRYNCWTSAIASLGPFLQGIRPKRTRTLRGLAPHHTLCNREGWKPDFFSVFISWIPLDARRGSASCYSRFQAGIKGILAKFLHYLNNYILRYIPAAEYILTVFAFMVYVSSALWSFGGGLTTWIVTYPETIYRLCVSGLSADKSSRPHVRLIISWSGLLRTDRCESFGCHMLSYWCWYQRLKEVLLSTV